MRSQGKQELLSWDNILPCTPGSLRVAHKELEPLQEQPGLLRAQALPCISHISVSLSSPPFPKTTLCLQPSSHSS